jgi:hypothetical protein
MKSVILVLQRNYLRMKLYIQNYENNILFKYIHTLYYEYMYVHNHWYILIKKYLMHFNDRLLSKCILPFLKFIYSYLNFRWMKNFNQPWQNH